MAKFGLFFPKLLKHEGGFVNDPDDPGGATNKGITMKTFRGCAMRILEVEPTLANLKALSDAQAARIYKPLYWDEARCDDIALQQLANIVFDFQVNAGNKAGKLLQRILNDLGARPLLDVDGDIGDKTIRALKRADQKEVYRRYKQGRIDYYKRVAAARPASAKFLKGWLNRVNSFPEL